MKVNKYLNDVLSDISTLMKKPLKERNMTGKVTRQKDDSYIVSFTNGRTGLGSDISIKILPQVKTNEYIASWASVEINVLSPAEFVVLNDIGLVFAEVNQTAEPVESYRVFERLDKPSKAAALEHLASLVAKNGVADFSTVGDKFVDRTFNRLIPELRDQAGELYRSGPRVKIDVFNDRGIYINGKDVAASITFTEDEVHLAMNGRPSLSVASKDAGVILQVLKGFKEKDLAAHPIVEQLLEQKKADAIAAKEEESARLQRRLEKARADVDTAQRKAEELAKMQERREYLASLPIAADDHVYAVGKTEFYDLKKDETPWKVGPRLGQAAYLIENDNKLVGVAIVRGEAIVGGEAIVRMQWLNEDVSNAVKTAAMKDLLSQKMTMFLQQPTLSSHTIFDAEGNELEFGELPHGVHILGSLSLSAWQGRFPPKLPDNMVITRQFRPHPEERRLPKGLKAGYVSLQGTKIEVVGGDVEIRTLHAANSRLKVIENGFKGQNIDLSRTFYISSIADDMDLDTLNLNGSSLRAFPRNLTVNKLDVTGSYIRELRRDTIVTGEAIGLPVEEPSLVIDDDIEIGKPSLS